MGFHVAAPHNISGSSVGSIGILPNPRNELNAILAQQQAMQPPKQPGLMDLLAQGVGSGLGQGIAGGIQDQIKQSILQKALSKVNPRSSAEEQYRQILQESPQVREELLPLIQLSQQQRQSEAEQRNNAAYGSALSSLMGEGRQPGMPNQGNAQRPDISGLSAAQAKNLFDIYDKQRAASLAEKKINLSETKALREEYGAQLKTATEKAPVIDRMIELNESGELSNPVLAASMDKIGASWALSPGSQEYNKHLQSFLSDVKTTFGSQISAYEVQQFMKGLPTLSNSQEGRRRILNNMKLINESKGLYGKVAEDIIEENGGIPPLNLRALTRKRVKPELDAISDQLREGLQPRVLIQLPDGRIGEVPQDKLSEALGSGAKKISRKAQLSKKR